MESLFLSVLNMSITAGWLVLAVLVLRLIFKKAPKALIVAMWALVGIRLLCPFTVESALSLIPSSEPVPQEILASSMPSIQTGVPAINATLNPVIGTVLEPTDAQVPLQTPAKSFAHIAAIVWLAGAALMLLYAAFSYLRIRRRVREAMPLQDRLWLCDHISSPFILGILRPRIYVPSSMGEADLKYVMAHENAHLRRRDHWWKPLGFLLLCIHWFNPLLWLGYIFLCRDIELACDEAVLRKLGTDSKKPYSEALLNCSIPRRTLAACPLAFGEVGVRKRIKSVLSYKKPALWIILAAALTCTVLAVCFLTNPKTDISLRMDLTVRNLISSHHRSEEWVSRACCTEYELLGMKKRGRTTTLYLSALYEEYSLKDGMLYVEMGVHSPTVLTLRQEEGMYTLKEYWEPRDGAYYPKDIRKKFPIHLWNKAMDTQRYVERLQKSCEEQAREQLKYASSQPSSETAQETLKQKYPEYFGLSTDKGLEVYVWSMGEDSYCWVLREGRNSHYTWQELSQLPTVTTEQICAIVASYGLPVSDISILPTIMPHSSYSYNIDGAYRKTVEELFWTNLQSVQGVTVETKVFDIDGDGMDESCTLGSGMTSGAFTFTLSVTEKGVPEYYNVFSGSFHYLSFGTDPDGRDCLIGKSREPNSEPRYFYFEAKDGDIEVYGRGCTFVHFGEQGIRDTPWQVTNDLDMAVSRAIWLCHTGDRSEGGLCTQSYVLLEQEQLSGTPLFGQEDHIREIKVYVLVMDMQYNVENGIPQKVCAAPYPTVITFAMEEGLYALRGYDNAGGDYKAALEKFTPTAVQAMENLENDHVPFEDTCDALAEQLLQLQNTLGTADQVWMERYYRTMRTFPE